MAREAAQAQDLQYEAMLLAAVRHGDTKRQVARDVKDRLSGRLRSQQQLAALVTTPNTIVVADGTESLPLTGEGIDETVSTNLSQQPFSGFFDSRTYRTQPTPAEIVLAQTYWAVTRDPGHDRDTGWANSVEQIAHEWGINPDEVEPLIKQIAQATSYRNRCTQCAGTTVANTRNDWVRNEIKPRCERHAP